jgi:hypothetical protein
MGNLRQIKNIIYQLKKDYGTRMSLRNPTSSDQDRKTGTVLVSYQILKIRRGIWLPEKLVPSFVYDLSFIAANKNFTYGGLFGAGSRVVIVDGKDVPSTFIIKEDTQLVIDKVVYSIKNVDQIVNRLGYLLTVTTLSSLESSDEF